MKVYIASRYIKHKKINNQIFNKEVIFSPFPCAKRRFVVFCSLVKRNEKRCTEK